LIKKISLGLAVIYSILLIYLSFGNLNQLPKVRVSQIDKFYHFVAYLILALLWLYYVKQYKASVFYKALGILLIIGCVIEFLQHRINPNRAFEYADMLSNVCGIILGAITIKIDLKVKSKS